MTIFAKNFLPVRAPAVRVFAALLTVGWTLSSAWAQGVPATPNKPARTTFTPAVPKKPAPVTEAAPGAMVRVPARVDALEGPEGRTRPVVAGGQAQAPWTAGVSFWRRAGERVGALVVNAEPQESDAARL
ncbi:MAG: hypothetical protein EBS16_09150, partial [Betaproteobacteria bacterium]|nr:hypothetical protein [Betaproteobacteria bacterium]